MAEFYIGLPPPPSSSGDVAVSSSSSSSTGDSSGKGIIGGCGSDPSSNNVSLAGENKGEERGKGEEEEEEEEEEGEKTFVLMDGRYDCTRRGGCQESIYCQAKLLEEFPDASRVFSWWYAGLGPVTAGGSFRRKIDCTLLLRPGEFLHCQYQGGGHYSGHVPGCHRRPCDISSSAANGEEDWGEEEFRDEPEEDDWSSSEEEEEEREREEKSESSIEGEGGGGRGSKIARNGLHGEEEKGKESSPPPPPETLEIEKESVVDDGEGRDFSSVEDSCEDDFEDEADLEDALTAGRFIRNEATLKGEHLVRRYLRALNQRIRRERAADESFPRLKFDCSFDYACNYFHARHYQARAKKNCELRRKYPSLSSLLKAEHPYDSIVPSPFKEMREKKLMEKILNDDSYAGLVTIRGGFETRLDLASLFQGFCLTKHRTEAVEELGPFARLITQRELEEEEGKEAGEDEEEMKEKARRALRDKCKKRQLTIAKRSFGKDSLATLSCQHLRFLVQHRGLRGFRLVHLLKMELRDYLFPFVFRLLQERHRLKKEKTNPLRSLALKISLNSFYGFMYMENCSFAKCSIRSLSDINKKGKMATNEDIISCTLLGTREKRVKSKRKGGGRRKRKQQSEEGEEEEKDGRITRDLIYCITRRNSRASIENVAHAAATVLCNSRIIFQSHLLFMLSCSNPSLLAVAYLDTGKPATIHFAY